MSKKNGIYGLIVMGVVTVLLAFQLHNLKFNYDFNTFFPSGDPDLAYYERITEEFGMHDDFLYLAVFDKEIYSSTFLERIDKLTHELKSWPEVVEVLSPTNYYRWQVTPFGLNRVSLYRPGSGLDSLKVRSDRMLNGQFIAHDKASVGLVVRHQFFPLKADADSFYRKYKAYLEAQGFDNFITSGKVQAQDEFVVRLEKDLSFNLIAAMVMVVVTLALLFKTARGVWMPMLALLITTIWNMGLYAIVGKELDVMMVIVPPILLIVSMSDIIHFCNKFNELVRADMPVSKALSLSFKEVGFATLLTSLTTAIGFLTLIILPIKPIRDFGLYTGIGIMLAYIIAFSLIPCLLAIMGKPVNSSRQPGSFWTRLLPGLFIWVMRHKIQILVCSVLLSLMSLWVAFQVQENTSILVGVERDDPLAAPVVFFDEQYDGYKPFELTMELSKGEDLFSADMLNTLDELHKFLETDHGVKHLQSPLTLIKSLNQALKGGATSAYALPTVNDINRVKRLFNSSKLRDIRNVVGSEDGVTWRINGRCRDLGSAIATIKNEALLSKFGPQNSQGVKFRLTGTSYLIDKTNSFNVRAILNGLLIAVGVIALFILVLTRDIRLTFISILPNLIPLLVVGALMGLMKVDLNLSTAIIFSVAFGIAVDDSIHFISRYVLEKRKGRQNIYAIKRTFLSTGKSIILTSIVLFAGFAIFLNSGFSATYYIGFFVCTTLGAALLADLLLLPVLLHRTSRR
ncbi:MAG: MMPL family transporter [Roseivirga sp.]|nr:MMPL family transporter [Roseivirga sp.]